MGARILYAARAWGLRSPSTRWHQAREVCADLTHHRTTTPINERLAELQSQQGDIPMRRDRFSLAPHHTTGTLFARFVTAFVTACLVSTGAFASSVARPIARGDFAHFLQSRRKTLNITMTALKVFLDSLPPELPHAQAAQIPTDTPLTWSCAIECIAAVSGRHAHGEAALPTHRETDNTMVSICRTRMGNAPLPAAMFATDGTFAQPGGPATYGGAPPGTRRGPPAVGTLLSTV
jgi:hypothetical protein